MTTTTDDPTVATPASPDERHRDGQAPADQSDDGTNDEIWLRTRVTEPPRGRDRIRWWGPGLLWAMSSVGSGSILFTPRIGSEYGYELLWLLLGVAFLMWVMIREAGRFAVLTGRTLLDGFRTLPGPRNWALWVVFLPQLLAAVVGVGGLSALVGSALAGVLPGSLLPWSLATLAASTVLVVTGGYSTVSRVALVLALGLVGVAVAAATEVMPSPGTIGSGLVPGVPSDVDVPFVLPWIGTILAGSMGILWYSYWAATRGYGGGAADLDAVAHPRLALLRPEGEGLLRVAVEDRHREPPLAKGDREMGQQRRLAGSALLLRHRHDLARHRPAPCAAARPAAAGREGSLCRCSMTGSRTALVFRAALP